MSDEFPSSGSVGPFLRIPAAFITPSPASAIASSIITASDGNVQQATDLRQQISVPTGGRIIVVETIYFRPAAADGAGLSAVDARFLRKLKTDEQPFIRHTNVGDQWVKFDCGWVEKPSMIVVENREGIWVQVNPTQEERSEVKKRIVEVCFAPRAKDEDRCDISIPPGEVLRFSPTDASMLMIRCRHGRAKIVVHAFPE
jgi:hypothetical protein